MLHGIFFLYSLNEFQFPLVKYLYGVHISGGGGGDGGEEQISPGDGSYCLYKTCNLPLSPRHSGPRMRLVLVCNFL